ncbi:MAG: hypothetical protein NC212_09825 [Staphylococcus sp.]|nr:hypothetical protein [Staphylococcus sp.]
MGTETPIGYDPIQDPIFLYTLVRPIELSIPTYHFIPGEVSPFRWKNGEVAATGIASNLPGMMGIESGAIWLRQSAGRFLFQAGGLVNKYGYYGGLNTQYGISGRLTYQISPGLSLSAFGSYYFGGAPRMGNGVPLAPAMLGYYSRSSFGASIDYQFSKHFGVEAGVQAVQHIGTRRYSPEPIVTPYIQTGGKHKVRIGLPVGQILYHVLKR